MATARAIPERRRSARVLIRIPVKVFSSDLNGEPMSASGEVITVSRYGALLRAPFSPALGSRIEVLNALSQQMREFRVVRIGDTKNDGCFELGVEILHPARNFWGIRFPEDAGQLDPPIPA